MVEMAAGALIETESEAEDTVASARCSLAIVRVAGEEKVDDESGP
jgi:hypothetical protein